MEIIRYNNDGECDVEIITNDEWVEDVVSQLVDSWIESK